MTWLTDIAGLSKPATKLIESISSAIGAIYEPTRIRRKATAEGDAEIILTRNRLKITELERRATERLVNQELRRQENIEAITRRALDDLPQVVNNTSVDQDWIYDFFDKCQDVSNGHMQSLWAKLLAGEVARPGKFSLRSLNIVKLLQANDAHLFSKFGSYVWKTEERHFPIVSFSEFHGHGKFGILDEEFFHLKLLGLIDISNTGISLDFHESSFLLSYFDSHYECTIVRGDNVINVGRVALTQYGRELFPISGAKPDAKCKFSAISHLKSDRIKLKELPQNSRT